ncbi:MAG: hypothetical protein IJ191_09500 [Treponema sp.]|nr:hypothetical protein [Treponema sp.]
MIFQLVNTLIFFCTVVFWCQVHKLILCRAFKRFLLAKRIESNICSLYSTAPHDVLPEQ